MDFFSYWQTFNSRFDEGDLTALTQLVGYKLLAIDNERKHPDSFILTDRELMSRTNIKSGQTIVEARRQLKNAGLIDFKTKKNKPTRYWFPIKHETSTNNEIGKHQPSTGQAQGLVSYTQAREDVKKEEKKDCDDAGARGGQGEVAVATGTPTQAKPLRSPYSEAEDVQELWEKSFGYALRGNRALELERLWSLDKERAKEGIERTKKRNEQLRRETRQGLADHFRYFNAVYDGLTPKTVKEDESPKEARSLAEELRYLEEISGER